MQQHREAHSFKHHLHSNHMALCLSGLFAVSLLLLAAGKTVFAEMKAAACERRRKRFSKGTRVLVVEGRRSGVVARVQRAGAGPNRKRWGHRMSETRRDWRWAGPLPAGRSGKNLRTGGPTDETSSAAEAWPAPFSAPPRSLPPLIRSVPPAGVRLLLLAAAASVVAVSAGGGLSPACQR